MIEEYSYTAKISISGEANALSTTLFSLKPEVGHTGRTDVDIDTRDRELHLGISAADVTALRAAINSYLRWIHEALAIHDRSVQEGE